MRQKKIHQLLVKVVCFFFLFLSFFHIMLWFQKNLMVLSETRISFHYKQEILSSWKKKHPAEGTRCLLLPWPQLYIMNLLSARDWRCKRTGGAQIPVILFTQRYLHNTYTNTHKHFHNISFADSAFVLYYYFMLVYIIPPCVSRRTQWSVGELWVTPRVLCRPCSVSYWHYTQGDQSWSCLSVQNLDQLGSTCKNIATMPQKRNNPAAPYTIMPNFNSPPTKPLGWGIFLRSTYF